MSSSSNDLPSSVTSYKPQILKIKIGPFRSWIERRLTELLEGLEDEILWGLVFNYLEDAQKRSKREGPAANPSGGLNAKEIQTALSGFLGLKQSRDFTTELFNLLAKAEASDTGIPPEFNMKPEEAENEAFGIIQSKRKEMELSDRVKMEIRRSDYHNRGRDIYDREERRERDYDRRGRDYDRRYDNHDNRERDYNRERNSDRDDNRRPEHSDHRHTRRNYSRSPEKSSRDRHRDRYDDDRRRYRDDSRERYHRDLYDRRHDDEYDRRRDDQYRDAEYDTRRRDYRHSRSRDSSRRRSPSKSPIPSSSPESSPSPCWETTLDAAKAAAPRAPVAQENVSNELEQALKARALKALVEKRK